MKILSLTKKIATIGAVGTAALAFPNAAMAATDGTGDFDAFYTKVIEWISGGLGKTIGAAGLVVGGVQLLRNAYASAAAFAMIGLLLSLGPTVLDSIMGALV